MHSPFKTQNCQNHTVALFGLNCTDYKFFRWQLNLAKFLSTLNDSATCSQYKINHYEY